MLRRVRLFKDGAGFVLHFVEGKLEETERIPPSLGDHLLYARVKELGLSDSADLLLKGEELVVKNTRHRWKRPSSLRKGLSKLAAARLWRSCLT